VSRHPHVPRGARVGLLGGSFDPAHEGHAHITREAIKRLGLDQVWWLVSPGNPLKEQGPAALERRMAKARAVMDHPKLTVTDIESDLGTRYTSRTLSALRARYRGVNFVWLMGADNLAEFHHWRDWEGIFASVPIAVLARPGHRLAALRSRAARQLSGSRLPPQAARLLPMADPPAWCFLNIALNPASSTAIRDRGDWNRG